MDQLSYFEEAMNTIRASRCSMLCARWFGRKVWCIDYNGTWVLVSQWRGKTYLLDHK